MTPRLQFVKPAATMNSQNKQVASSLVSLPFDLMLAVLCFVPNVPSLRAVISTCTALHRAFQNAERLVTERILSNQMGSRLLRDATVVLESSRLKNSWSRNAVEDFLQRQKLIITIKQLFPVDHGLYLGRYTLTVYTIMSITFPQMLLLLHCAICFHLVEVPIMVQH